MSQEPSSLPSPDAKPPTPRTPLKRRIGHWLSHNVFVPVGFYVIRAISRTWRKEQVNVERAKLKPAIFAIYHGDLVVGAFELPEILPQVDVLASRSRDGSLVARFVHMFRGARTIRGSSSRGGTGALLSMGKSLRRGRAVVIPIDGPRGPFGVVKPGVIAVASQTGAPIIAGAVLTDSAWRFRSWDRAFVCKPKARVRFIYGEPLFVPPDADRPTIEEYRLKLEQRLHEIHHAADGLIGSIDAPAGREKRQKK